jgi:S-formylglutathione hydrolase FrmB
MPEAHAGAARSARRNAVSAAVATGSIGVLVVGGASAGVLDAVPLLNNAAAVGIEALAGATLLGSWLCAGRRWQRRTLPILLAGVAVLTGLIAAGLWLTGTVSDAYPPSFGLWIGLAFAAVAGFPLALRARTRRARRGTFDRIRLVAASAAVPLTIIGALMLIDNEYGIWPQVGDLLGHNNVVGAGALRQARPAADRTGTGAAKPAGHFAKGVVAQLDAPGTASHLAHRPGVVYLPPAYFRPGAADLPVLILLSGTPGTPINWIRAGRAEATADRYAAAHHGVAPILVIVDQNGSVTGDTECVDGPQGNAETYLTVDVPAFITTTLHVRHDPARWGIVGFSEGGTCALGLVLAHPDLYRHIVDLDGEMRPRLGGPTNTLTALFGGSLTAQQDHDPLHLLATRRYHGVTGWFAAGLGDHEAVNSAQRIATAAAKAGIVAHEFTVTGAHNWQFAGAAFSRILPRLCVDLGCTGGRSTGGGGR